VSYLHSHSKDGGAELTHPGAGIVLKTGPNVSNVREGDPVLITYASCGHCKYCAKHETSFCNDWFRDNFGVGRGADGSKTYSSPETGEKITSHFFGQSSFAKRAIVGKTALVKLEEGSPLEMLAPMGCGIQTGAGGMLRGAGVGDGVVEGG
jgi:aryl-alcohol dehydrogenase